jgi:SH3 domain protein
VQSIRQVLAALCLFGVLVSGASAQQTRWVTDEWRINLRSGAGNEYRIIEVLPTGTTMQLLESGDAWSRVRIGSGAEGWVPSQYLMSEPPAAQRLQTVQQELTGARERIAALEAELQQVTAERDSARQQVASLGGARERLTQQLDQAREGLELSEENKLLKKQVIDLQRRIQDLESETVRLADRSRQDWFLVGAGVLFAGMLVGIIMTRIRWRRRSSWNQL